MGSPSVGASLNGVQHVGSVWRVSFGGLGFGASGWRVWGFEYHFLLLLWLTMRVEFF